MINDISNVVILAARLFLAPLFLIFGWRKLTDYSGTVSQMVRDGLPMPILATAIAIFMELPVAFAVAIGAFTRASAVLLALYTLGTSLVEHRYWTVKGAGDSTAWRPFTKTSASWGASCCYILLAPENIRSMYCATSPRHNFIGLEDIKGDIE
jgi:putative oxidoreductase